MVFDKTGTLTQGKPQVMDQLTVSGKPSDTDNQRLSSVLHAMAVESQHPLSQALAAGMPLPGNRQQNYPTSRRLQGLALKQQEAPLLRPRTSTAWDLCAGLKPCR